MLSQMVPQKLWVGVITTTLVKVRRTARSVGISDRPNCLLLTMKAPIQFKPMKPSVGRITGRNVHCFSLLLAVLTLMREPSAYLPLIDICTNLPRSDTRIHPNKQHKQKPATVMRIHLTKEAQHSHHDRAEGRGLSHKPLRQIHLKSRTRSTCWTHALRGGSKRRHRMQRYSWEQSPWKRSSNESSGGCSTRIP